MSETDDTDELLLIPPNLFQIPTELESTEPYFDVVSTLISQVNSLRGRVRNIEDGIEDTVDSTDEIRINRQQMHHHGRGFNSAEDLGDVGDSNCNSKGSSPTKGTKVAFNSLPSTPSTDRSTLRSYSGRLGSYSNPRNRYTVDNTRLQSSTRVTYNASGRANISGHAARNLSAEFDTASNTQSHLTHVYTSSPTSSGISDVVDRAIKGGAAVTKLTVQAVQEVGKGESRNSDCSTLSPTSGKSRESMETAIYRYNPQAPRHINFEDERAFCTARNLLEVNKRLLGSVQYDRNKSDGSTAPTSANETNSNTFSTSGAVQISNNCSPPKANSLSGGNNPTNICCDCDISKSRHNMLEAQLIEDAFACGNLLSLSDLFSGRQNLPGSCLDVHHIRNKLTEEKLRRLHCEQLIQDLQTKVLELQQKFSVALEIDKYKTDSIEQFQKTWTQIAKRVQEIITERNRFEQDLFDLQTRTVCDLQDAAKKVEYYENEASKALNLATKHHEKVVQNDNKMIEILAELENYKSTIIKYENNIQSELKRNMELSRILGQKEIELSDSKKVILDARKEIAQSKQAVEICQGEFNSMKNQYTELEVLLHNKQEAMKQLEIQKRSMCQEIEKLRNVRCKHLEDELAKTKATVERNKTELRQFYQSQLEIVVQEKLTQFQKQLDQAEINLQMEMKNREQTVAETAAQHIQQLSNKHRAEVRLLEAKHSEQLRLQHLQLQQAQIQLHEQQERKQHIASQLHQMMELQWREAVRIINSTKGGNESECGMNADESAMLRMERLHQELNDRSRTNLEDIFQLNANPCDRKAIRNGPQKFSYQAHVAEAVKPQDNQSKCKTSGANQLIDADLQKCIDMLLNRPATIVAELPRQKEKNSDMIAQCMEESSSTELYNMAYTDGLKNTNANAGCSSHKSSKRPWK